MAYNMTAFDESNNFFEMFVGLNTQTTGLISVMILTTLFIIILFLFKDRYDTKAVLLGDSFIITILASLFFSGGLIGLNIVLVCVGALVTSIFVYMFSD